jgi:hypothetical protein
MWVIAVERFLLPYTPLDFESTTTAYTFVDFDGGVVTKSLILIRL